MKINSYELIGILNSALIECNEQFYDSSFSIVLFWIVTK